MVPQSPASWAWFRGTIAAAATQVLVAGSASKVVYLYELVVRAEAALAPPSLQFQDTAGNTIWSTDFATAWFWVIPLLGLPLVAGRGAQLLGVGALTPQLDVTLLYSQY
jgi:hypothetical protein